MRQDIGRLMREQGLAGMVVFAYDRYSPALYYATGQKIHFGMYVRAADDRAHLVHDAMERDQAAQVGCETSSFAQHRIHELIEQLITALECRKSIEMSVALDPVPCKSARTLEGSK